MVAKRVGGALNAVLRSVPSLLAAGVLLTACSTADFKKPITDFSAATTAASTGFEGYANSLDKTAYEQNVDDVVHGRARIEDVPCRVGSKCDIRVIRSLGVLPLRPQLLQNTRKLMAGVVTYAKNLEGIASSDDVAAIKTAGDAIPGAIANAARAADALNAQMGHRTNLSAEVGVFTPVANIIIVGLTKYAEIEKLKALREATSTMETVFPQITVLLSEIANSDITIKRTMLFAKRTRAVSEVGAAIQADTKETQKNEQEKQKERARRRLDDEAKEKEAQEAFEAKQEAFKAKKVALLKAKKDALEALDTTNEAYNTAVAAKPSGIFAKLRETHTALANALLMPDPDFRTVFALIQQLADMAATLAKEAKAIDEALHPKPKA
jgi:hypothetical protein